jgi:Putative MetA-pathway of phenol degradation
LKICVLIFGVGLLVTIDLADAGPPFVTDDPEPPPRGGWEINVPFILERTPGRTEMDAPLLDLNYGLPEVQLKVEFPIKIVGDDVSGTDAGAGDLLLGVKWRFLNNEKSQLQFGVYPQLLLPTGDRAGGLGEGRPGFVLPVLAQKSWDKWTLYGNAGYWWQTAAGTRDYFYAGVVLEREISDRLTLGLEFFGNSPTEHGAQSDVAFNLGGSWKVSEHVNFLFTGGRDIVGDTRAVCYVGLQVLTK